MNIAKSILLGTFLILGSGSVLAQTETKTYGVTFRSENQSMWKSSAFELDMNVNLFDVNWNQGGGFDGVKRLVGKDFGASFDAFTRGNMSMEFYLNGLSSGTIDEVVYPVDIEFTVPETNSFKAGEVIRIESDFSIDPSAYMSTTYPNGGKAGARVNFDMDNRISVRGCMWSCGEVSRNMDVSQEMHLFQVSSQPNETFYPGLKPPDGLEFLCYTPPSVIPYMKYHDNLPVTLDNSQFFSGTLNMPNVSINDYERKADNSLTGRGNSHYISTAIDVTRTLLSFSPYKLENTIQPPVIGCLAGLNYKIMSAEVVFDATNHQEFKFEPSVDTRIKLPAKVDYRVLDGNSTVKTGNSDEIVYKVGHTLEIKFPCNFEFLDIQPEFMLNNKFTNHTYDVYDVSLKMEALEFGIDFKKITVVPKIKVCVPLLGCATTPEVAFNPPDMSMGPLWERTFNIGTIKRDWHKDSWELKGFQTLLVDEVFRVAPERFDVELTPYDVDCNGATDGHIDLTTNGEDVIYQWSNESTGKNLENVGAGDYYVKVIDKNGCEVIRDARISQPSALEVDHSIQHCQCYGDETGQIELQVEGGTGVYSFLWSNGQTTQNLTDVTAGEYEVTVTDEAGCEVTRKFRIEQPTPVVANVTDIGEPLCFGSDNGFVETSVKGGTFPYNYEWNNGATTQNLKNLGAGEYILTVTDQEGCTAEAVAEITEPELLEGQLSVTNEISCYKGGDGELKVDFSGGTGPYAIKWMGEEKMFSHAENTLSGLESGSYRVTITDANGCSWRDSIRLESPADPFYLELTEYHLTCHNGGDGAINAEVFNGVSPFDFTWSGGAKNQNISGLEAGKHTLSVTDARGCVAEASTVLLQPSEISARVKVTAPGCIDADDGQIEIIPAGGNPPYQVKWSTGDTGVEIDGIPSGIYMATITDDHLCSKQIEVEVPVTDKACVQIPSAFTPNGDGINDTWEIEGIEYYPEATIKVFSKWGELIYSAPATEKQWDGTYDGERLQAASYYYVIDLGDGTSLFKGLVTIIR